jgi:osmotically-inducible protein OsmY
MRNDFDRTLHRYNWGNNYRGPVGSWERSDNSPRDGRQSDEDQRRGWWDRAGDEVLSWLGDDYAVRRRRHDDTHRGKGPKNYRRSDERIREDVSDRLTDEWSVDASDIEVKVIDGEVTLTGFVNDRFQKRRAEAAAESVSGVSNVENRLRIGNESPKDNVNLIP